MTEIDACSGRSVCPGSQTLFGNLLSETLFRFCISSPARGAKRSFAHGVPKQSLGIRKEDLPGKLPGNQEGEGGITGLDDLRQKWTVLEQRWGIYLGALRTDSLDDLVYN